MSDAALVGQERTEVALQRAAQRPVHAYLVTGPTGSGAEVVARRLAALLIGADDERSAALVERGVHPDVVEFEPAGLQYRVKEDVRQRIIPEASRSPIEGERKVLVVHEAERLRGAHNEPANALLKTLEEPPPRTTIILVTAQPDDLLPTIRSRCQRIDLDPISTDLLVDALVRSGVASEEAERAAALSGGQVARAHALVGPLRELRACFASVPGRLDGTGATVAALATELDGAIGTAAESVTQRHQAELAEFDADMERHGYDAREAGRLRRRLVERHEREARRARTSLLLEGITAMESVYRDVFAAPAPARNDDVARPALDGRACADALDRCRRAREAFLIQEKGLVRLQHLLLSLPESRSATHAVG
ncbi:MAG TPA: hypothetical protein VFZ83_14850 [Acidimicrobiia bacterium]|nr:hypothetical protein [Acidimicrobiia bacterium]